MTSLFMPFDTNYFWGTALFFTLFSVSIVNFMFKTSSFQIFTKMLFAALMSFFYTLKPKNFNKMSSLFFISMFMFLMMFNFLSVFSFNFPATSQVSHIMMISLGFWMSLIFFSVGQNMKGFFSHLIPEGTPLPLTFLLFAIELVSSIIRPLTLMVRLVANILAGHLLMSLLSSLVFFFPPASIFYVGLNVVELFVALIQSYIFSTMIVLYFSEI